MIIPKNVLKSHEAFKDDTFIHRLQGEVRRMNTTRGGSVTYLVAFSNLKIVTRVSSSCYYQLPSIVDSETKNREGWEKVIAMCVMPVVKFTNASTFAIISSTPPAPSLANNSEKEKEYTKYGIHLLHWLLNESPLSKMCINKDAEEAMRIGVWIDPNEATAREALCIGCIIRYMYEKPYNLKLFYHFTKKAKGKKKKNFGWLMATLLRNGSSNESGGWAREGTHWSYDPEGVYTDGGHSLFQSFSFTKSTLKNWVNGNSRVSDNAAFIRKLAISGNYSGYSHMFTADKDLRNGNYRVLSGYDVVPENKLFSFSGTVTKFIKKTKSETEVKEGPTSSLRAPSIKRVITFKTEELPDLLNSTYKHFSSTHLKDTK